MERRRGISEGEWLDVDENDSKKVEEKKRKNGSKRMRITEGKRKEGRTDEEIKER